MMIPNLVQVSTLEAMIAECKATFESLNPGLLESESDYYMPVIEAQAEREFRLRIEINTNFKNQFWMVAEGEMLDMAASEFGVIRIEGSKPYASFRFTLSSVKDIDVRIPAGMMLGNENGEVAHTIYDLSIPAGTLSAETSVELEGYIETSESKTEQILTPLPYILEVKQLETYHDGKSVESDASLKDRVSLSLDNLSAAGPVKAYKKKTLDADSRIKDVNVFEIDNRVQIVIDSDTYDVVMEQRVSEALNAEEERPLTDKIDIYQSTRIPYGVIASLEIKEGYSASSVVEAANLSIEQLKDLRIGENLSMAKIIDSLFVDGVKDINLTAPTANLTASETEVLHLDTMGITHV